MKQILIVLFYSCLLNAQNKTSQNLENELIKIKKEQQ